MTIKDWPEVYRDATGVPVYAYSFSSEGRGLEAATGFTSNTITGAKVGNINSATAGSVKLLAPGVYEITVLDASDPAFGVPPNEGVRASADNSGAPSATADVNSFIVPTSFKSCFVVRVEPKEPWVSIYNHGAGPVELRIRRLI